LRFGTAASSASTFEIKIIYLPKTLITLAHFQVSSAINRPKSAGEPARAAPPVSSRARFIQN
jgi:hypothetical protein